MLRPSTRCIAATTALIGTVLLLGMVAPYIEQVGPLTLVLRASSYFTVVSTALTTAEALLICISPPRYTRQSGLIASTAMSVGMLVICALFEFIQPAHRPDMSIRGAHFILPVLGVSLCLLTLRDTPFRAAPRLLSTSLPAIYLAYTQVYGGLTHSYPYWWADPGKAGVSTTLAYSVEFGAIIYCLMALCWNRVIRWADPPPLRPVALACGMQKTNEGSVPARSSRNEHRQALVGQPSSA